MYLFHLGDKKRKDGFYLVESVDVQTGKVLDEIKKSERRIVYQGSGSKTYSIIKCIGECLQDNVLKIITEVPLPDDVLTNPKDSCMFITE